MQIMSCVMPDEHTIQTDSLELCHEDSDIWTYSKSNQEQNAVCHIQPVQDIIA